MICKYSKYESKVLNLALTEALDFNLIGPCLIKNWLLLALTPKNGELYKSKKIVL